MVIYYMAMNENRQFFQLLRGNSNVPNDTLKDGELALHKMIPHRDRIISYSEDGGCTAYPSLVEVEERIKSRQKKNALGSAGCPISHASFQDNRLKWGSDMLVDVRRNAECRDCFANQGDKFNCTYLLIEVPSDTVTFHGYSSTGDYVTILGSNIYHAIKYMYSNPGEIPTSVIIKAQITNNESQKHIEHILNNGQHIPTTSTTGTRLEVPDYFHEEGDKCRFYFYLSNWQWPDTNRDHNVFILRYDSDGHNVSIVERNTDIIYVHRGNLVYDCRTSEKSYPGISQGINKILPQQIKMNFFIDMLKRAEYDVWWKVRGRVGVNKEYSETATPRNSYKWRRFLKINFRDAVKAEKYLSKPAYKVCMAKQLKLNDNYTEQEFSTGVVDYLTQIMCDGGKKQIHKFSPIDIYNTDGKIVRRYIDFAIFEYRLDTSSNVLPSIKRHGAIYRLYSKPVSDIPQPGVAPTIRGFELNDYLIYQGPIDKNFFN